MVKSIKHCGIVEERYGSSGFGYFVQEFFITVKRMVFLALTVHDQSCRTFVKFEIVWQLSRNNLYIYAIAQSLF